MGTLSPDSKMMLDLVRLTTNTINESRVSFLENRLQVDAGSEHRQVSGSESNRNLK